MARMKCPRCDAALDAQITSAVPSWACSRCRGVLVRLSSLRLRADAIRTATLWARARAAESDASRSCPLCNQRLRVWTESADLAELELDACISCEALWFDQGEAEVLLHMARPRPRESDRLLSVADGTVDAGDLLTLVWDILDVISYFVDP